jgi:inorganic triphosphatase YgiF
MSTAAGEVLTNYLAQELEELKNQEPMVRQEIPDSVHQMRMCARRLRPVLATGKKLLDDGAVTDVRAELRWLFRGAWLSEGSRGYPRPAPGTAGQRA